MPANVTIYCLDEITDYYDFERLCSDLMALREYRNIEPLGGFSDKGRDAIHVDATTGRVTLFAYSVREDWRAKLAEDAAKIRRHGHACDQLIFLTPARCTAGERDEAVQDIKARYGWKLELYGAERLRILLEVEFPHVRSQHPSIFPPDLLALDARRGTEARDHLYVCCAPQDKVVADWLVRRLVAEGYLVWYEYFKLLGGENYPENVDDAISHQAYSVIALYSRAALQDPEVTRQRNLALALARERGSNFLIPVKVEPLAPSLLDRVSAGLIFVPFADDWAKGLRQLLRKLETAGCPRPLGAGRAIAAETFMEQDVLVDRVEKLMTNCLTVRQIPSSVQAFVADTPISDDDWEQLRLQWACRRLSATEYLSFHQPSSTAIQRFQLRPADAYAWRGEDNIRGIPTSSLIAELIRLSLDTRCGERGLRYCDQTGLHFFPEHLVKNDRLPYILPTGARNSIGVCGMKTFWRRSGSSKYKYAVAPRFSIVQNLNDEFTVLVRLMLRFTDTSDDLLPKHAIKSRRKDLCKGWWNDDWLKRIVAVCQFLADGDVIAIGTPPAEQLVVDARPLTLDAPGGINETALGELKATRAEFLKSATDDDDAEDNDE